MQYHHSTPYGNTTIFIGGGGGASPHHHLHQQHHHHHQHPGMDPNYANNNLDLGTFLQAVMGQLAGGLVGVGGPPFPSCVVLHSFDACMSLSFDSVMHNMGPGGHMNPMDIDAFLTQVTTRSGEKRLSSNCLRLVSEPNGRKQWSSSCCWRSNQCDSHHSSDSWTRTSVFLYSSSMTEEMLVFLQVITYNVLFVWMISKRKIKRSVCHVRIIFTKIVFFDGFDWWVSSPAREEEKRSSELFLFSMERVQRVEWP